MVQELHDQPPRRIEFGPPMERYYQDVRNHHLSIDLASEIAGAHQLAEYTPPTSFVDQVAVSPDRALEWSTRLVKLTEKYNGLLATVTDPKVRSEIQDIVNYDAIQAEMVYCQMFGRYHHEIQYVQTHDTATSVDISTLRGNGEMVEQWQRHKVNELGQLEDVDGSQQEVIRAISYVAKPEDGVTAATQLLNLIDTARAAVKNT